jgi:hypothetical protein
LSKLNISQINERFTEYIQNKEPEIVFHWKDSETEAEGWTVSTLYVVVLLVAELV